MKHRVSVLRSTAVMLYFIMLFAHNLYQAAVVEYLWYFVLMMCFVLGIFRKHIKLTKRMLVIASLFVVSAVLNIVLVGNNTVSGIFFTLIYLGVYELLADDEVDERYILVSIYADCFIMIWNILLHGVGKQIMLRVSNNFISVFLLIPTIIYYIRLEYQGKKIPLPPAIAVVVTALLSTGRSGIIATAMLLAFVAWYNAFFYRTGRTRFQVFMLRFSIFFSTMLLVVGALSFSSRIMSMPVFQRFLQYGMYGTGRSGIWSEYLTVASRSLKNTLFGVKYTSLKSMDRYINNLHNSFFNLHAEYGITLLLYIIYALFSNCRKCIKEKKWIYLSMIIVFVTRAMTDKIIGGGSAATIALVFILMYIGKHKKPLKIKKLMIYEAI